MSALHYLRNGGVSVLVDASSSGLPVVVHWGADLGDLNDDDLQGVIAAAAEYLPRGSLDELTPLSTLPEHLRGWPGRPGLSGSRGGRGWSPVFGLDRSSVASLAEGAQVLTIDASSATAGLGLRTTISLAPSGVLTGQHTLTNTGEGAYTVDQLAFVLPLPPQADELLDLTGRWIRERAPQRHSFDFGIWAREGRRGKSGFDNPMLMIAGTSGFGFGHGQTWGLHLAWSGNYSTWAEKLPNGKAVLASGELLLPREVNLAPGESYSTPDVHAVWSDRGIDGLSAALHTFVRARPSHPKSARPLVFNTWEAVYFNHDLDTLTDLARTAAGVGAERFVLDDGWFKGRRDDKAGLGDWHVDDDIWPRGLSPLIDVVRELGMDFGLWFEPEMVNPDSDLARARPEWILSAADGPSALARSQHVLDIGQQGAYDYVLERIDSLLTDYDIAYLKWDHNRELYGATTIDGTPGVHAQTLALYRLLDELKARHPGLEIESCSSGGARVDLGILAHTDRVWASDCTDALERQLIQRWTGLVLPAELIGSHVSANRAHTTYRQLDLSFRAATAMFGHMGVEWDVSSATPAERAELAEWIALYKRLRPLLHTGEVVRLDTSDPSYYVHGVVSQSRDAALFAYVQLTTSPRESQGRLQLKGLDPDARYRVTSPAPGNKPEFLQQSPLPWLADGVVTTGRVLAGSGLQSPNLQPEQVLLIELTRAD